MVLPVRALIGLPLAIGWWHADRRGLIREAMTDDERRGEFVESFTEPIAALLTLPFAYVGELHWNLAWLAYFPVSWLLRRRGVTQRSVR
jgi:hypothetical protein